MQDWPPIESAEEFRRLRLSKIKEEYERSAWAPAPDAVWAEVIDRWPELRVWVAHNRSIPAHVIERLAADPDADVRNRIAEKHALAPAVLERLLEDPEPGVRLTAARNQAAPLERIHRMLAAARDPWTRRQLTERLQRRSAG